MLFACLNLTCLQRTLVVNIKKSYLILTICIAVYLMFVCSDNREEDLVFGLPHKMKYFPGLPRRI